MDAASSAVSPFVISNLHLPGSITHSPKPSSHQAGDRWLIRGPLEYVPSAKVEVVEERQAIPLDENEGIYVQDVKTGRVTAEGWAWSLLCGHGGSLVSGSG